MWGSWRGHCTAPSGEEPGWGARKGLHQGLEKVPAPTGGCLWRARLCAQTRFGCWEEKSLCFTTRRHRSGSKQDPEHPWVVPPRSSIPTPLPATGSAQQFPISNIPSLLPCPRAAPPAELLFPAPTCGPDPIPMTQDYWGAWKGASHPPAPFASHSPAISQGGSICKPLLLLCKRTWHLSSAWFIRAPATPKLCMGVGHQQRPLQRQRLSAESRDSRPGVRTCSLSKRCQEASRNTYARSHGRSRARKPGQREGSLQTQGSCPCAPPGAGALWSAPSAHGEGCGTVLELSRATTRTATSVPRPSVLCDPLCPCPRVL